MRDKIVVTNHSTKPFQLLIFDWDGTLMDSEARIITSFQAAIADLGLEERRPEQLRPLIGLGLGDTLARLFPDVTEQRRVELADRYHYYFWGTQALPTPLFPGVFDTLRQLHSVGYWLAVATSKSRRGLQRTLVETGLVDYFHSTRCADECRFKPDPQMLLELMEELDVPATATLMIGDTEYDLQMANNAGVASVAVSYGMHEKERLLKCQPLVCLDNLSQLSEWLQHVKA